MVVNASFFYLVTDSLVSYFLKLYSYLINFYYLISTIPEHKSPNIWKDHFSRFTENKLFKSLTQSSYVIFNSNFKVSSYKVAFLA